MADFIKKFGNDGLLIPASYLQFVSGMRSILGGLFCLISLMGPHVTFAAADSTGGASISQKTQAADLRSVHSTIVQGRLAFYDAGKCNDRNLKIWREDAAQCHAFKRRFHIETGQPMTGEEPDVAGYRGLTALVEVSSASSSRDMICPKKEVESDLDGFFKAELQPCYRKASIAPWRILGKAVRSSTDQGGQDGQGIQNVKVRVKLLRSVSRPGGEGGEIRALWVKSQIQPLYNASFDVPVYEENGDGQSKAYVVPVFETKRSKEKDGSGIVDLGVIDILKTGNVTPSIEGYLNLILIEWQSMIAYHQRLKDILSKDGKEDLYFDRMLLTKPEQGCSRCYTLFLTADGYSFGREGVMYLLAPRADIQWSPDGAEFLVGHEFGHSIHFAIVGTPFDHLEKAERRFSTVKMDAQGQEYPVIHWEGMIEDMPVAFVEGVATALGQYLLHGCSWDWHEDVKSVTFPYPNSFQNVWDLNASCDAQHGCNYHRFRWHMAKRGIAEGSSAWTDRLARADALSHASSYLRQVTSNSETRYSLFTCDLLTSNADITHVLDGKRTDLYWGAKSGYLDDYLYYLNRIFDGVDVDMNKLTYRTFSADVGAKNFRISLVQYLEALGNFCPLCQSTWLPAVGDADYGKVFLSAHGPLSPQSLGLYMVDRGWMAEDQLNNVLRANFMEEILHPLAGVESIPSLFVRPRELANPPPAKNLIDDIQIRNWNQIGESETVK